MGTLHYQMAIRNRTDTADELVISSVPTDDYPYIADPVTGDGATLDPVTGKVSVGAYTVRVIDAVGTLHLPATVTSDDFSGYTTHTAVSAVVGESFPPDAGADADDIHHNWGVVGAVYNTIGTITLSWDSSGALKLVRGGVEQSFGGLYAYRIFTGLTDGQQYTARARFQTDFDNNTPWGVDPVGMIVASGGTETGSIAPLANGAHVDVVVPFMASGTTAEVRLQFTYGNITVGASKTLLVKDVSIDGGTATDVATRIVTGSLADVQGRQQLLSRKAYVRESEDGGTTWRGLTAGFVSARALRAAL